MLRSRAEPVKGSLRRALSGAPLTEPARPPTHFPTRRRRKLIERLPQKTYIACGPYSGGRPTWQTAARSSGSSKSHFRRGPFLGSAFRDRAQSTADSSAIADAPPASHRNQAAPGSEHSKRIAEMLEHGRNPPLVIVESAAPKVSYSNCGLWSAHRQVGRAGPNSRSSSSFACTLQRHVDSSSR